MFTQCPQCRTVYQVAADDLRRAHGTVRCGECREVFDAIAYLSPEPPAEETSAPETPEHAPEESIATPDEGAEVEADGSAATPPPPEELAGESPVAEDESAEVGEDEAIDIEQTEEGGAAGEDLTDQEDWRSLLAELDLDEDRLAAEAADTDEATTDDVEGTARAESTPGDDDLYSPDHTDDADDARDDELGFSEALFDELVESGELASTLASDTETAEIAAGATQRDENEITEATEATDAVRAEATALPRQHAGEPPRGSSDTEATGVPGMPTTSDRDTDRDESEEEPFIDTGPMPPGSSRNRTLLWSVVAVLLILSLGAQVIHAQREYLATVPGFGPQLQRVYGALGMDLEPRWDIGALCVESSSGDAATDALEISSVIAHRGERPQPYPHLQVALTDRWQSIIGRRTIPPGEYLPDGAADGARFRPGERIDARVRLADPGSAAAGYELHVCYRSAGEGLRCSGGCP